MVLYVFCMGVMLIVFGVKYHEGSSLILNNSGFVIIDFGTEDSSNF
jgi:hypothetical protein